MTSLATLYSFRRCPYAIRARMALLVSDVPFAIREVDLRDKPTELIAASPKATVPVLVLANGQVIDESLDIMRWALRQNDPEHWLTGDDVMLIEIFDTPFKQHLDRYKYAGRDNLDAITHRTAAFGLLQALEDQLTVATNLCHEARSLTDIAVIPFVRQFAAVDPSWFDAQPIPQIKSWLAGHIASPLFEQAMVRSQPQKLG